MESRFENASLLKAELDGYVLGQEESLPHIAMAITSHLIRIRAHARNASSRIRKDNVLLAGPTGCGKTETFRVLQRLEGELGLPIIMRGVKNFAPDRSWQGIPLETVLSDLFDEASNIYRRLHGHAPENREEHENFTRMLSNGIILLDEFDKLAIRPNASTKYCHDYQTNLLKMVEGDRYCVGSIEIVNEFGEEEELPVEIDTSNVMFIFLGAFEGLEDITRARLAQERRKQSSPAVPQSERNPIGFMVNIRPVSELTPVKENLPEDIDLTPSLDDIIEYGIMRELAGRIPVRVIYKPLSITNLVKILQESKTSVYLEYQERFQAMGHSLSCDNAALHEIARMALEKKSGARGLSEIFNKLLSSTMYRLSGTREPMRCILRGADIRKDLPPVLQLARQQKFKTQQTSNQRTRGKA